MSDYKPLAIHSIIYKDRNLKRYGKETACFSSLRSEDSSSIKEVIYLLEIDETLTNEHIQFYLNFLSKFLNKSYYSYRFLTLRQKKYISFRLNCSKDCFTNSYKIILYLTAFRMLGEFPEILIEFYNRAQSRKTLSCLFKIFQLIHFDFGSRKLILRKYDNQAGHCLIYRYGYGRIPVPIKLKDFKDNWNNASIRRVMAHFEKSVPNQY